MEIFNHHDTWAFSVSHDFQQEQDDLIKSIKNSTTMLRVFYGKMDDGVNSVVKGVIKYDKSVSKESVKKHLITNDVFAVTNWERVTSGIENDNRFKKIYEVQRIGEQTTPTKPDPSGLKGLDFIPDSICPNCGV